MKTIINPRTGMLVAMILSAGVWRVFISSGYSPLTNFTPIGAMALFGGCYFADKKQSFLITLLTLWLSDLLLSYFVYYHEWKLFYDGFLWTYGSFVLIVLMGTFIKKANVKNVVLASVFAALAHWVITDFGVWIGGRTYPMNAEGLTTCYIVALPYLKNMLIGNLVFGAAMFGAFEFAQRKFPVLSLSSSH